jgi:hypothetical protein
MKRTVVIAIHYISLEFEQRVFQKGEFKLRGKSIEQVAFEFWRRIKKESSRTLELEKVLCDGEDITEKVKELVGKFNKF